GVIQMGKVTTYEQPQLPSTTVQSISPVKLVVPLMITLTAGTGGMVTARSTTKMLNRWIYDPGIHIEHSNEHKDDARTTAELVGAIRDALGLNMSDLAAVMGVTRPTAYAWLNGQEPRPDALKRIQELFRIADELTHYAIHRMDMLVKRPVFDGKSFLDRLLAKEDLTGAFAELKHYADKEVAARRVPKSSGKYVESIEEAIGHSMPFDSWG
ncbi:helix-turn-helix domain-containing protein, partial [Thiolapillus sp.]|uniref:helix-turn-helix domain-containing protein n=2 Tax=Thiolapillus sp. TaxID=2017437 RepID=UPI003AF6B64B